MTGRVPMDGFVADTRACCCLRRWSTQVVLDWNQRILRAAEAGDPQGTDQGFSQARRISENDTVLRKQIGQGRSV